MAKAEEGMGKYYSRPGVLATHAHPAHATPVHSLTRSPRDFDQVYTTPQSDGWWRPMTSNNTSGHINKTLYVFHEGASRGARGYLGVFCLQCSWSPPRPCFL